jgi:hypothetical protein
LLDVERPSKKAALLEGSKKAALVRETSLQTSVLMVLVKGAPEKELPAREAIKGLVETVNSEVEVGRDRRCLLYHCLDYKACRRYLNLIKGSRTEKNY